MSRISDNLRFLATKSDGELGVCRVSSVTLAEAADEIERLIGLVDRAARNERAVCQELAARYGGKDAETIAEMIGARNFQQHN